jgi:hypothetical protein
MKIKTTQRFHCTPIRMAKTNKETKKKKKNQTHVTADTGEDVEKGEHSPLLVGVQDDTTPLEISLAVPQKI